MDVYHKYIIVAFYSKPFFLKHYLKKFDTTVKEPF